MNKEMDELHRLFGFFVLRVLEREKEWNEDIFDEISDAAMDLGLAYTNNEGHFLTTDKNSLSY
jgi:hypothetical protein